MSSGYSLTIHTRDVAQPIPDTIDLTRHTWHTWQRSTRALGGYWTGDFVITTDTMSAIQLQTLYQTCIGKEIREWYYGVPSWQGEVVEAELTINGVTHMRSMDHEVFHNKAKVLYRDSTTNVTTGTAWDENTDSSDDYGESCYIDTVGDSYDATSSVALRDRHLTEYAYPRSHPSSGLAYDPDKSASGVQLRCMCAGYVFSMNRRYRESDTADANVSAQISTLVGESEFVTAGEIDTNTLQAPIKGSDIPVRLWDAIEELILMGDASGNRWMGGVFRDKAFRYEQAATTVTHYWRRGQLVSLGGVPVPAGLIRPDIIVQIDDILLGMTPPGGNVWDKTRNVYIEEVEFVAPDRYRLIPRDSDVLLVAQGGLQEEFYAKA